MAAGFTWPVVRQDGGRVVPFPYPSARTTAAGTPPLVRLKATCGPAEPVLTVMMPDEDCGAVPTAPEVSESSVAPMLTLRGLSHAHCSACSLTTTSLHRRPTLAHSSLAMSLARAGSSEAPSGQAVQYDARQTGSGALPVKTPNEDA
jgi:hypothetical protein